MTTAFFEENILNKGLDYSDFLETTRYKIDKNKDELNSDQAKITLDMLNLNYRRSVRIQKIYKIDEELKSILSKIEEPQIWMVLTEDWCGDSAQNLPYIAKMADENPLIDLRIFPRDENLDVMDKYLTNGKSRSIPKLVAFDKTGNELFQWGPRPKEAQDLVEELKSSGIPKVEFIEKLHLWYARNKGKALEQEFISLLCETTECVKENY